MTASVIEKKLQTDTEEEIVHMICIGWAKTLQRDKYYTTQCGVEVLPMNKQTELSCLMCRHEIQRALNLDLNCHICKSPMRWHKPYKM